MQQPRYLLKQHKLLELVAMAALAAAYNFKLMAYPLTEGGLPKDMCQLGRTFAATAPALQHTNVAWQSADVFPSKHHSVGFLKDWWRRAVKWLEPEHKRQVQQQRRRQQQQQHQQQREVSTASGNGQSDSVTLIPLANGMWSSCCLPACTNQTSRAS